MIARTTAVEQLGAIDHDESMHLAAVEYARLLVVADDLRDDEWLVQTECTDWNVKDMLGHLLGMFEAQSDPEERMRQFKIATGIAEQTGGRRLDAMTALQVSEHAALTPDALRLALHDAVPRALAGRTATTAEQRAAAYSSGLPGEGTWTFGYLFDVILTRDPWIHRVDISRAIERDVELTADHDGRLVADVVADWARRHGQPFTLTLSGAAGDRFTFGTGDPELELDAIEFCRILSGRAPGSGLLSIPVPF
jgi:uncharacterized protein (TIGR03083 family)